MNILIDRYFEMVLCGGLLSPVLLIMAFFLWKKNKSFAKLILTIGILLLLAGLYVGVNFYFGEKEAAKRYQEQER